jgi:hypothetical protein
MGAYQFKSGAHIPKSVTPEGVMEERDRIEHDYGKVTIEHAVDAVLKHPEKYPNLRAFGPADEGAAMRQGITEGIRRAFRAVVIVRDDEPKPQAQARQIRVLHNVQDSAGDLVYRPITAIRQSPDQRKYLIGQLRRDAALFADKMRDVLAEVEEIT